MCLDLTTTSHAVHIINLSTGQPLYWIRKEELARKRDGNLSEWIMHRTIYDVVRLAYEVTR